MSRPDEPLPVSGPSSVPVSGPVSSHVPSTVEPLVVGPIHALPVLVARERRKLRDWLSIGAKVMWAGSCVYSAILLALNNNRPIDSTPMIGVVISLGLAIASIALSWSTRSEPGEIDFEDEGGGRPVLHVRSKVGDAVIGADRIASLYVSRPPNEFARPTLEIDLKRGDMLYVSVSDVDLADRIAVRLGFGPHGRRTRVVLDGAQFRMLNFIPAIAAFVLTSWVSAGVLRSVGPAPFHLLFILVVYQSFRRLIRPRSITIGSDGVVVEKSLYRRTVAASDIESMKLNVFGKMAILRKHDKAEIEIGGVAAARRRVAIHLLESRFGSDAARTAMTDIARRNAASAFVRDGRTVKAWRDHAHALLASGDTYRASALLPETAKDVLSDPLARTEERAGAAMALAATKDPECIERIRIAAEASIDRKTRVALQAIADGDDERIERALRRSVRT